MPSLAKLLFAAVIPTLVTAAPRVMLVSDEPGSWPKILNPVGIELTQADNLPPADLAKQVEAGVIAILVGDSEYANYFGIQPTTARIPVRSIVDLRQPKLQIVWEKALELPVYQVPDNAQIFAKERWAYAPMVAGIRKGKGAILWLAVTPGEKGYERFPYIVQSLVDLGAELPLRSNRLWAFFDGAYRSRADLDYLAERWRNAGISTLHVAAWHYIDAAPDQEEFLARLVAACHRHGIQLYAWLELPHVSEKFWRDRPACRERTAILQDAHLDWRKLINLNNPDCAAAASEQVRNLLERFDWDGVNLAELYYESLEGTLNPSRFTPMNDDVRAAYQKEEGVDPLTLFQSTPNPNGMAKFLSFRAELVRRLQQDWIAEIEKVRAKKPHLDLVLTHVDDRFDTRMRDLIGADASRVLPLLAKHDFTFLIEDPATVWHLGPERYTEIAKRYAPLTPRQDKLAIDINIVERYQDVYPTKQQTGTELFQLVNLSSKAFARVALYFENSILKPDLELMAAAAAAPTRFEASPGKLIVDSQSGIGVQWTGPLTVNGKLWPVTNSRTAWLPSGPQVIQAAPSMPPLRIEDFNGQLRSASVVPRGLEFSYESSARAFVRLSEVPGLLEIDGEPVKPQTTADPKVVVLPRGQHYVHFAIR